MPLTTTPASRAARYLGALALVALLLAATLLAACDSDDDSDPGPAATTAVVGEPLTILTAAGAEVNLRVEVAETREQRTQGLMGRTELAPDSGMLFIIEPPGHGFWMKDTILALTVAFIGQCGELVDFADLEPLSEEVKNTDRPYAFALEMEQGWFDANGVAAGDTLRLPDRLLPKGC